METLNDPAFGELIDRDEAGDWYRWYEIDLFGERKTVHLAVTYTEKPTEAQRATFLKFEQHKQACIDKIEKAIFNYYNSFLEEVRAGLEEDADEVMPVISTVNELNDLVTLEEIIVAPSDREIGFLFECTWEIEHGLGVQLRDNEVTKVGFQDVVI